jgi:hypothetical protein
MMALSWSLANFVAGASLTAAAVVAIGYSWMELKVDAEEEAPHAFPRTASQHDPQECGAWRQGNIALIHSAPTEERGNPVASAELVMRGLDPRIHLLSEKPCEEDGLPVKPGHDEEWEKSRKVKSSVPALGFFHRRELLGAGLALKSRLPGLIGHAVDGLAAFVLAYLGAPRVGLLLEPVGQAVAAEARKIHEIDVLDIGAGAQMFDQAPENGGFEFRSGFVVKGHDRDLAVLRQAY